MPVLAPQSPSAVDRAPTSVREDREDRDSANAAAAGAAPTGPARATSDPLADPAVRAELTRLQTRDREVRAHEQAHLAAGGRWVTSGPSYSYRLGPDGKRYAVGGEVGIDASPVSGDPQATIDKARQVRVAALAPAQPSAQDLRIAAQASSMEQQAQQELARVEREATYTASGQRDATSTGRLLVERA